MTTPLPAPGSLAPNGLPYTLNDDTRLSRAQATVFLREVENVPTGDYSLGNMASTGGGPPFAKVGRAALYAVRDLRAWAAEKTARTYTSTAEARAAQMAEKARTRPRKQDQAPHAGEGA